jgi:hypothetical protein
MTDCGIKYVQLYRGPCETAEVDCMACVAADGSAWIDAYLRMVWS